MVRVAALPSAWQPMQPFDFSASSHCIWFAALPSGNSFFAGTPSMAYQ